MTVSFSRPRWLRGDGRMNSPSRVIILAEDQRQARFVRAYLRNRVPDLHHREIFDAPMANGHGSGAQWVINHFEAQILAHLISRTKKSNERRPEKWLMVVIDADNGTVQDRLNEFRSRIEGSKDERVRKCSVEKDNVARLIPKWSIETWILNLNGETVDEKVRYKSQNRAWDSLTKSAAVVLHGWVSKVNNPPGQCTLSLSQGIGELSRLTS